MTRSLVAIAMCLLTVAVNPPPMLGQTCPNASCQGVLCTLDGILNVPLGNVNLFIDDQCRLVLNGIGSSGIDGVLQPSFVNATVMQTTFGTPNFSGSIQGTKAVVTAHGVVDGIPNQEISVMEVVNFDGANIKATANCQSIGVTSYITEIFSGLTLVKRVTGIDPPAVIYPKADFAAATCGLESNGNPFTSFRLKSPKPIAIQVPLGDPGPFVGDFVMITALSPTKVPTLMTDIENRFTNAGAVSMAGLFAGPLGARCTSNSAEVRPGLPLCDFDNPAATAFAVSPPVAAVLPSSRAVQVGTDATAFAAIINPNTGSALKNCGVADTNLPFPGTFRFQTTSPATNVLTLVPNTAADIKAQGVQTFAFSLGATQSVAPIDLALQFGCENSVATIPIPGVNTFLFSASQTPRPDVISLAATPSSDGIVNISGATGTGVFAVATVNLGSPATVTVSADTGSTTLPLTLALCQTDPTTGSCTGPVAASVTTAIGANAMPTFGVFVTGTGNVPFNPATNRVFVRFKDGSGVTAGLTSVAVQTK